MINMPINTSQTLTIHFPGKLVLGKGSIGQLPDEVHGLGCAKALIVTIDPLVKKLEPLFKELESRGVKFQINTSIVQEPSFKDFENLMQQVTPFHPDVVIGIGGGSVLDIAKLVAAQINNEQKLSDYVGIGLLKGRK